MIIKREILRETLLKRMESIDDNFAGFTGEKYIYILDLEVSQRYGYIKNHFWILNKINETDFIAIPNKADGFVFTTHQQDGVNMIDINNNNVLVRDENGEIMYEEMEYENDEGIVELISNTPLQRLNEFSRNIDGFAPILADPIFNTIDKYLGNH